MKIKGFILYHSPTGRFCVARGWGSPDAFHIDNVPYIWSDSKIAAASIEKALRFAANSMAPEYQIVLKEFCIGLEVKPVEIVIGDIGVPSGLFSVASIHRPVRIK